MGGVERVDTEPYTLRGEENCDRSLKWSTGAHLCTQPRDETELLRDFFHNEFQDSGLDFGSVDVDTSMFPSDTCPGLPWTKWGFKTKQAVIDAYGMEKLIQAGELQIDSECVPVYEFCKTEAQKVGKEVRTITCYPIHVHLAHIKWLSMFSTATKKIKEVKIGWNKWQGGIQNFCSSHTKPHKDMGDGRKFDSRLPNIHVEIPLEEYFMMFPEYEQLESFFDKLINGITCCLVISSNGQVYIKLSGNPSGCIITGEINSCCNDEAYLTAFMRKCKNRGIRVTDLRSFREHNDLDVYGDDQFGSHDDQGVCCRELNSLLTDLTYDFPEDEAICQDSVEGLTFLGNTFYKQGHLWLWRPAKPKKILSKLKFTEKRDSELDINLELSIVRGLLVECAWDADLWNTIYPYQQYLERLGASCTDPVLGIHVNRARVEKLTFGEL